MREIEGKPSSARGILAPRVARHGAAAADPEKTSPTALVASGELSESSRARATRAARLLATLHAESSAPVPREPDVRLTPKQRDALRQASGCVERTPRDVELDSLLQRAVAAGIADVHLARKIRMRLRHGSATAEERVALWISELEAVDTQKHPRTPPPREAVGMPPAENHPPQETPPPPPPLPPPPPPLPPPSPLLPPPPPPPRPEPSPAASKERGRASSLDASCPSQLGRALSVEAVCSQGPPARDRREAKRAAALVKLQAQRTAAEVEAAWQAAALEQARLCRRPSRGREETEGPVERFREDALEAMRGVLLLEARSEGGESDDTEVAAADESGFDERELTALREAVAEIDERSKQDASLAAASGVQMPSSLWKRMDEVDEKKNELLAPASPPRDPLGGEGTEKESLLTKEGTEESRTVTTARVDAHGREAVKVEGTDEIAKEREEVKKEVREEVMKEVREEVREELKKEVREEVKKEVREAVKEEVRKEVREAVKEEVREEVREAVKDEVREAVREAVIDEVREEVREAVKQEVKQAVKQAVKKEVREEVEEEVREEVRKELRVEMREKSTAEDKGAMKEEIWEKPAKEEARGESLDAVQAEVSEELMTGIREELRPVMKAEARGELREEVKVEVKEELREETKAELRAELRDVVRAELRIEMREGLKAELKDELREQLKEEFRDELREELKAEVRDELREEVKAEVREELREEVKAEVREKLLDELKEEVRGELREDVKADVREKLREEVKAEVREDMREAVKAEVGEELRAETRRLSELSAAAQSELSSRLSAAEAAAAQLKAAAEEARRRGEAQADELRAALAEAAQCAEEEAARRREAEAAAARLAEELAEERRGLEERAVAATEAATATVQEEARQWMAEVEALNEAELARVARETRKLAAHEALLQQAAARRAEEEAARWRASHAQLEELREAAAAERAAAVVSESLASARDAAADGALAAALRRAEAAEAKVALLEREAMARKEGDGRGGEEGGDSLQEEKEEGLLLGEGSWKRRFSVTTMRHLEGLLRNEADPSEGIPEQLESEEAEAPGAEAPGAEAPGTEAPVAEAPVAEAPGAEAPGAEAPGAEAPGAEAPEAEMEVSEVVAEPSETDASTSLDVTAEPSYAASSDAPFERDPSPGAMQRGRHLPSATDSVAVFSSGHSTSPLAEESTKSSHAGSLDSELSIKPVRKTFSTLFKDVVISLAKDAQAISTSTSALNVPSRSNSTSPMPSGSRDKDVNKCAKVDYVLEAENIHHERRKLLELLLREQESHRVVRANAEVSGRGISLEMAVFHPDLATFAPQHLLARSAAKLFINSLRRNRHLSMLKCFTFWSAFVYQPVQLSEGITDEESSLISPLPNPPRRAPVAQWNLMNNVFVAIERVKMGSLPGLDHPATG